MILLCTQTMLKFVDPTIDTGFESGEFVLQSGELGLNIISKAFNSFSQTIDRFDGVCH